MSGLDELAQLTLYQLIKVIYNNRDVSGNLIEKN